MSLAILLLEAVAMAYSKGALCSRYFGSLTFWPLPRYSPMTFFFREQAKAASNAPISKNKNAGMDAISIVVPLTWLTALACDRWCGIDVIPTISHFLNRQ